MGAFPSAGAQGRAGQPRAGSPAAKAPFPRRSEIRSLYAQTGPDAAHGADPFRRGCRQGARASAIQKKYNRTLRSTIYALLVVAALAVLVATIFLPVLAHELSE